MVDINQWMKRFVSKIELVFPNRIVFIGLQGSYARGEATETSDIDVVVIFDRLVTEDIKAYDKLISTLLNRDLICGFISGKDELINWEPSDLFQFCHDTVPVKGSLDVLLNLLDAEVINRAIKIGACNIYHACVHNMVHEKSMEILCGLYKSAVFVIQALHYHMSGEYLKRKTQLISHVEPSEREIIELSIKLKSGQYGENEFDYYSDVLFKWSQNLIINSE